MNRRNLLAAAPAALALAGTAAAAPNLDADLIAHCAAFDALERAYRATGFGYDVGTPADDAAEAERERLANAQDPIVEAICAAPPRTLAGFQAVAASLALWDAELFKDGGPEGYTNQESRHRTGRIARLVARKRNTAGRPELLFVPIEIQSACYGSGPNRANDLASTRRREFKWDRLYPADRGDRLAHRK